MITNLLSILLIINQVYAGTIPDLYKFKAIYNTTDKRMWFTATVPKETYFAIGFGTSMTDSGVIFMSGKTGDPSSAGYWAHGHAPPDADSTQDFKQENVITLSDGSFNFTMSRALDTGASKNAKIVLNKTIDLIWAANNKPEMSFHNTGFGTAEALIKEDGGGVTPAPVFKPYNWDPYDVHGLILWISWFLLGFAQVFFGRWFPYATVYTGFIHAFLGWLVFGATIFAVILAQNEHNKGKDPSQIKFIDFKYIHFKFGWILVFILAFFTVTGVAAFMAKKIFKWNSKTIRQVRWVHRLVAYVMWGLSTAAVYSGMDLHITYVASNYP